jgi:hypothetical protein
MKAFLQRIVKKIQEKYKDLFESSEIFRVEQEFMEFFGYWPRMPAWNFRFILWMAICVFLEFFPKLNYLRGALSKKDYLQATLSISKILPSITNLLIYLNFKLRRESMVKLIDLLEAEWKRTDQVESQKTREKSLKYCIKIKKFVHLALLIPVIFYLVVPFFLFIFRFLRTGLSRGEKFKPPTYVE